MPLFRRIRDYAREYQQRQEKARREGYHSYGAKRYAQEAPKREAKRQEQQEQQQAKREAKRQKQQEQQQAKSRPSERKQLIREAIENYRQKFGTDAKISTVSKGVRWLSTDELREVGSASRSKLRQLARREPRLIHDGKELNPYWYH